jgi:hypothetical protein
MSQISKGKVLDAGDTLNGVALDLDADSRCGLLSGRAAAETDAG